MKRKEFLKHHFWVLCTSILCTLKIKILWDSQVRHFLKYYGLLRKPHPCRSVLDFRKINLEKSSSMNWIFSLFQPGFLLPVYYSVACKNQFRNWFFQTKDPVLSNLIFTTWFSKIKYRSTGGLALQNRKIETTLEYNKSSNWHPPTWDTRSAIIFSLFVCGLFKLNKMIKAKTTPVIVKPNM